MLLSRALVAAAACLLIGGTAVTFVADAAGAADLGGQVVLTERGRPARGGGVTDALVWFEPAAGASVKPRSGLAMTTKGKEFAPRVLAVPRGSTVAFPNEDPILHNVFSLSPGNRFDLGFYRKGQGKRWTFTEPGVVRVFCNVHHAMVGYLVVLDTPHHAAPDARGHFHLAGVPAGAGTVHVWHERTEPWSRQVTVPLTAPLRVSLAITRPRVPAHTNKLGKSYVRDRESGYR